ncbi:DNA methyltransferase [Macrococcoides canis]|uniref:Modification methylase n=1 Tax=Macrococcoides canis TaxID=1855823 RepID=A0A4R6C6R9_9STAP|nr:DNA methyltransferase [Macrococcus canis]TDM18031.1 modification methylase [Macrococcus canis]
MKLDFYKKLEGDFKVIYPNNENATYTSLLNYSDEKKTERQRWYRYKEGYSIQLMKKILKDYNKNPKGVIMDPFLGSGTTVIAANELGLKGIGFEVNPFSYFLSTCKINNYNIKEVELFKTSFEKILNLNFDESTEVNYELPKLSIANKTFEKVIERYLYFIKSQIDLIENIKVKNLLKLGWLSSLELVSNYRKAGNGLKKRTSNKNRITNHLQVSLILEEIYLNIFEDISKNNYKFNAEIYNDSSLNMNKYINEGSLSGVIFSPPYANAFDYTEIYKIELWFGEFVKEYTDLKKLRNESLRSHLNGLSLKTDLKTMDILSLKELDELLDQLSHETLWDKKIPLMLKLYFSQMFKLISDIYMTLEEEGFCSIVVGNSSYGGVIFPTDLLLAKFAKSIGFKVDKIEVDRYIITSSQQYNSTIEYKKYLRESIICLVKI